MRSAAMPRFCATVSASLSSSATPAPKQTSEARLCCDARSLTCYTPPGPWVWGHRDETARVHYAPQRSVCRVALAASAQEREGMRRIGVLMTIAADGPEAPARLTALAQGLQQLGWTVGRNVRIDHRCRCFNALQIGGQG